MTTGRDGVFIAHTLTILFAIWDIEKGPRYSILLSPLRAVSLGMHGLFPFPLCPLSSPFFVSVHLCLLLTCPLDPLPILCRTLFPRVFLIESTRFFQLTSCLFHAVGPAVGMCTPQLLPSPSPWPFVCNCTAISDLQSNQHSGLRRDSSEARLSVYPTLSFSFSPLLCSSCFSLLSLSSHCLLCWL